MGDTRRVLRFYWVWEDEREEAWLSKMAAEGWHLERVIIVCYTFRRGEPRAMSYRLDYRRLRGAERPEYLALFRDAGWEYVNTMANWHYFRSPAEDGHLPEIYTDRASRVEKYRRVLGLLLPLLAMNLAFIVTQHPNQSHWYLWGIRPLQLGAVILLGYAVVRILFRIGRIKRQSRGV